MKVLLTGASGFLGKNFLELAPKDIEIIAVYNSSDSIIDFIKEKRLSNVRAVKCNLSDEKEVKDFFKNEGDEFDFCLYLAGNVNVPLSKENPKKDFESNVTALVTFLNNSKKIKRFVYMSTAGVYDGLNGKIKSNASPNPKVPYCISKLSAEQYVKFFHGAKKIDEYVILRFGGAFGKYSEHKFMTKLVKELSVENKKEIEVYGDGTNIINVMYINDAVSALLTALKSKKSNIICNLGQENMTIKETVQRTAKALGKDVKITYTEKIKGQKYIGFETVIDFNKEFNFIPKYSFEEGIKKFSEQVKNAG